MNEYRKEPGRAPQPPVQLPSFLTSCPSAFLGLTPWLQVLPGKLEARESTCYLKLNDQGGCLRG